MAVVNVKAASVTNADASIQALSRTRGSSGRIKETAGTVEVTNGDSIDSVFRLARVHSSWRISRLLKFSDAITAAIADFGLHDTAVNGAAIVDRDFFASAVSIVAADNAGTDVAREAAAAYGDVANIEKTIWEALGLSADPNKYYDLTAMLTVAATATGTLSVLVQYVDGN
jgi:hypothetical protein